MISRRWDKSHYDPGEECRLTVHGDGLGEDPLSVTVERENEDGTWTAVARLQADVADGEDHAVVAWRFPEDVTELTGGGNASLEEADGSVLRDARFEDPTDLEEGGPIWMRARAAGFEGKALQVVLEREGDGGEWVSAGEAVGTVRSGELRTSIVPADDSGS